MSSKTKADGTPFNYALGGCVWPGRVHYPDFNNPNTTNLWH